MKSAPQAITRPRLASPLLIAFMVLPALLGACAQGAARFSAAAAASGPTYEVQAASIPGLGTVLVNGQGFTLYMFEPDKQGAPTCNGTCAVEWPPLLLPAGVTGPQAGPGVRASLLGTVRRADGGLQVTYASWPLYRWNADVQHGQATGQGLYNQGGRWYVMGPAGQVVRK